LTPKNTHSDQYESGLYSSRPILKQLDRTLLARLSTAETLYHQAFHLASLSGGAKLKLQQAESMFVQLNQVQRDLALAQGAKAITGALSEKAASDLMKRLEKAISTGGVEKSLI